jgi:hypothetical protein
MCSGRNLLHAITVLPGAAAGCFDLNGELPQVPANVRLVKGTVRMAAMLSYRS